MKTTAELPREAARPETDRGLWGDGNFLKLWAGQSLSMFGSQITTMAVPLIAAASLDASPMQMGILHAAEYAPFLLFGLFAGVWVDGWPKRPLLIASDLGRAALYAAIPLLALLGSLHIGWLWLIAFLAGILTTFYSIGYQSILPYMLGKHRLTDANAKLELSRSFAGMLGPGFAGLMVQWLSGPLAIVIDAVSFVVSGSLTMTVAVDEPQADRAAAASGGGGGSGGVRRSIGEGLRFVFADPCLRAITACSATTNFFLNMIQAILILYATRELGFTPAAIGLLMTLSTAGAAVSAFASNRLVARHGFGPVIACSAFLQGAGGLFLLGAVGGGAPAFAMMFAAMFVLALATTLYNVAQVSYRQSVTEPDMLGRVNATMRFVVWGVIPLGALCGGALGAAVGLYATIATAVCGGLFSFLWVYLSPMRRSTAGKAGAVDPADAGF